MRTSPIRRGLAPRTSLVVFVLALTTAFAAIARADEPVRVVRRTVSPADGAPAPLPQSGALPPPHAIDLAGERVEIPMRLVDRRPVVEARIDGKGPFRLGIETGAAFVALTRVALDSLHLQPSRHDEAGDVYAVSAITTGGATFRGVEVRDAAPVDTRIDGFLGLGAFQDLLLTLDYPHERVVLERGALPAPDGQHVFAAAHAGPFVALDLDVAGRSVRAVLDTRGASAFGVTPDAGAALSFAAPPVVVGQARGAAIPVTEVKLGRLAGDVRIGDVVFQRPLVSVHAAPPGFPDAILGAGALVNLVVTLDQRAMRVRLVPGTPGPIAAPPPVTDLGMRLRQRPGEAPEVGDVRPGTPADSLGVRAGDRLIEANGMASAQLDPARWRSLAGAGQPVALKLQRGEQVLELVVPPAILVP